MLTHQYEDTMNKKKLNFNCPNIKSNLFIESELTINEERIIINLSNKSIHISEENLLNKFESSILSNINIYGEKFISIKISKDIKKGGYNKDRIKKEWRSAFEIFEQENLLNTKLWRSPKERIDNIEVNLWLAEEGTDCGIHNKHSFKELHTQIYGLGIMQKFHQNDENTLYENTYMSSGYTHKPFYKKNHSYPWHQYKAVTDCIWLAIEFE